MGVLEGVTLLVQAGYSEHFVLEEITLDGFRDLLLVVQKMNTMHYWQIGLSFTSALAAVLSKEGAEKSAALVKETLNKIDTTFLGDDNDADDDEVEVRSVRKPKKPTASKVEAMLRRFHANFAKASGARIPTYDQALRSALKEQKAARPSESESE